MREDRDFCFDGGSSARVIMTSVRIVLLPLFLAQFDPSVSCRIRFPALLDFHALPAKSAANGSICV